MEQDIGLNRLDTLWHAVLGERLNPKNVLQFVAEHLCSDGAFFLVRDKALPNMWRVPVGGAWGPSLPDLPKLFVYDGCDFLRTVMCRKFFVLDEVSRDVMPGQLRGVGIKSVLAVRCGVSGVQNAVLAVCNGRVLKDAGKGFYLHYAMPDAFLAFVISRIIALDDCLSEYIN